MSIFKALTSRRTGSGGTDGGGSPDAAQPTDEARDPVAAPPEPQAAPGAEEAPAPGAQGRNMWDLVGAAGGLAENPAGDPGVGSEAVPSVDLPAAPAESPFSAGWRRSGRVRTKLLGIDHSNGVLQPLGSGAVQKPEPVRFPVGWLVVVEGPGRGHAFPLLPGVSQIGRGEGQTVQLDFGDTSISREGHALLAYDDEARRFYVGHGGKANLVRLNGRPLLSTEAMAHGDVLRLGETTLMLAALCGPDFDWDGAAD